MRTNKYHIFITVLFIIETFNACNNNIEFFVETIAIDFNNVKEIDMRDSSNVKILTLEVTNSSLIQEIKDIEFLFKKILIYTADQIVAFDEEGKFLFNIDRKGNGPGEYVRITSFYVNEDSIFLYDDVSRRLLAFDEHGRFLSSIRTDEEISLIYPLENQEYIAKNKYRGYNNETPAVCILDKNLIKKEDAKNRFLTTSTIDFDNFYKFKDEILYWEFLNDTIFSINKQLYIYPKYFIDFKDYKISKNIRENKDENEILDYINNSSESKIATCIKYINEDSTNIRFIFVQKEAIINYVLYNKENEKVKVFRIIDSQNKYKPQLFMKFKNGKIIMSALDPNNFENNPQLLFINEEKIK